MRIVDIIRPEDRVEHILPYTRLNRMKSMKEMRSQGLPKTDSIRELAFFWDKHDITDFEDLLEEVIEPVFRRDKEIHIHLKQDEFESIEKLARQRGLKKDDLIREWILEKLKAA